MLRERHNISYRDEDDFRVFNQADLLQSFGAISAAITVFLSAIAGISLLVGGIGVMNIMLVTVTERTREIGLRKAIGAKRRDILIQFLVEAMTLSLLGGAIGIAIGVGGALAVSSLSKQFQPSVSPITIALATGVSAVVGLFAGLVSRAARRAPESDRGVATRVSCRRAGIPMPARNNRGRGRPRPQLGNSKLPEVDVTSGSFFEFR